MVAMRLPLVLACMLVLARPGGAVPPGNPLRFAMTLTGDIDGPPGPAPRAERRLKQRLAALRSAPHDDARMEEVLCPLGIVLGKRGAFREARHTLAACARARKRLFHPCSLETAAALSALALATSSDGRFDTAESLERRALSMRIRLRGATDPLVATSLQRLGVVAQSRGDLKRAKELYEQALRIQEAAGDSPQVAQLLNNLGLLHLYAGDYVEAEALERRALLLKTQRLGTRHPDLGITLQNLAAIENARGRHEEAERLFASAIALQRRGFGRGSMAVVMNLHNLAAVQLRSGRSELARRTLLRALRLEEASPSTFDPGDRSYTLVRLAKLSREEGDLEGAAGEYEAALAIRRGDPDPDGMADLLLGYADVLRSLGRIEDAERTAREAQRFTAAAH